MQTFIYFFLFIFFIRLFFILLQKTNSMKITIESYGITRSIKTENDDLTFSEFMDLFIELVKGMYSPELVEDYFKAE